MRRLNTFHHRAIRYMTGKHIQKKEEEWEYPDHKVLLKKCELFPMEIYLKRRRGTLWKYFEEERPELFERAKETVKHSKEVNKIFWWNQEYISKKEMGKMKSLWNK